MSSANITVSSMTLTKTNGTVINLFIDKQIQINTGKNIYTCTIIGFPMNSFFQYSLYVKKLQKNDGTIVKDFAYLVKKSDPPDLEYVFPNNEVVKVPIDYDNIESVEGVDNEWEVDNSAALASDPTVVGRGPKPSSRPSTAPGAAAAAGTLRTRRAILKQRVASRKAAEDASGAAGSASGAATANPLGVTAPTAAGLAGSPRPAAAQSLSRGSAAGNASGAAASGRSGNSQVVKGASLSSLFGKK